ncbi:hypothetical protein ACROYT_G029455 [Oculina patagonica]
MEEESTGKEEGLQKFLGKVDEIEVPPELIARGRPALEAYNKALTEGKTFDKRVPVMLITPLCNRPGDTLFSTRFSTQNRPGQSKIHQERSGKTSLKKSLRGEPFNPHEESTVGIDVDPSRFKVTTEIWKVEEEGQQTNSETSISFEYHAARATVENLRQEKRSPDPEERISDAMPSGDIPTDDTVSESASSDFTSVSLSSTSSRDDSLIPESVQTSRNLEQEGSIPKNVETELLKILENVDQVKDEEDVHSVLWDFAGQSVYYTTHSLFSNFEASEKLDSLMLGSSQDEDKMRSDFEQIGSEIRNLRDKLDTLMVQGEETKDEEVPPELIARGRPALEAYNKALTEGKTFDKRVPVMLIGQERSGKTSLKKSLRGEPFNPHEESTVGIDVDPSHFKVTTEVWKVGEEGQTKSETRTSFEHHAARVTVKLLMENEKDEKERAPDPKERIPDAKHSNNIPMDDTVSESTSNDVTSLLSAVEVVVPSASSHTNDITSVSSSIPSSQDVSLKKTAEVPESVQTSRHPEQEGSIPKNVETEMFKILENVDQVEDKEDVHSVLWDFAGHSVYYTTHPLFLTSRAIYLLVNDLSQNPTESPTPIMKQELFGESEDSCGLKTNLDCLYFWMSSVASLASQQESDQVSSGSEVLPEKLPAVFLVFTHADIPYG